MGPIVWKSGKDAIGRRRRMRRLTTVASLVVTLVCLAIVVYLAGCGSGGGGGSFGVGTDQSGTGTVSVLLTDGPADEYEKIWITVNEVSLIPVHGDPVVLFRSEEGYEVDLLELRDDDFLLTVKKRVPAGWYEKVRLRISDIEAEGGPRDDMVILPSGKIDLNPRGSFRVVPGGMLSIRLDIDANKSIHLHPAGKSEKCIFRPVVFVDIQPGEPIRRCPQVLDGTILSLIDEDRDGEIEGFILDLSGGRGGLEVRLSKDTVVWNELGKPSSSDVLEVDRKVKVRGRLDAKGRLHASVVVIGDVFVFKGKVAGPVVKGVFPFTPDPGTGLLPDAEVEVLEKTLIFLGCDNPVGPEAIQEGMATRVFGWILEGDDGIVIRAAAVFLRPEEISGEVVSLVPVVGGDILTLWVDESADNVDIFLPVGVPIFLEGDGPVPIELLCEGQKVRVLLDPYERSQLTATEVQVESELLVGEVTDVDETSRMLIVGVENVPVYVRPGATILDQRGDEDELVWLSQIEVDDELRIFGLSDCSELDVFHAFVVLIVN